MSGMELLIAASVASTAVSTIGALAQGEAQAAQAQAQAQAQDYNAIVAENNARAAREQANAREEQQRRRFGALQGQAIAGIAQSGTGFEGSNADMLQQNAIANELDALTIRYEGQNQAAGLMAQSELDRMQAGAARANAGAARTASYFNAGANLLSGVARTQYYRGGGASREPSSLGLG